nr:RdRp [signal crayfish associated toti-like virus 1]
MTYDPKKLKLCVEQPWLLATHYPEYFSEAGKRMLALLRYPDCREGGFGGRRGYTPVGLRPRQVLRLQVPWPGGQDGFEGNALPLTVLRQTCEACDADHKKARSSCDSAREAWEREFDLIQREISPDELGRQRFIPRTNDWPAWGPRFGPALTLYLSLLPEGSRAAVVRWLDVLTALIRGCTFHSTLVAILKVVEGWAKVNGDSFEHWKALVGMGTLGGYVVAPPEQFFVEEVAEWVSGPVPAIAATLPGWHRHFQYAARLFVDGCEPKAAPCSFEQFVASGCWVRPGVTDQGTFPDVMHFDEVVHVRKNKDLMYLGTDPGALQDLAHGPAAPARAMVKRETMKSRAVVITDTPTYLRMAWLSLSLEASLKRSRGASLFFTGGRLARLWVELARDSANTGLWKFPIDQSKYDHMVTREMIDVVLGEAERLLLGDDQRAVMQRVRADLASDDQVVVIGDATVPVTKGVLSGWRWTALIDTWVNFSETVGSLLYLREEGIIPAFSLEGVYFQGDDVRFMCNNPGIGVALCEVMREAGFQINPSKTWVSPLRDEFLRKVGQDLCVSGYLSRTVASIMWRNPISAPEVSRINEMRSVVSRWELVIGRGGSVVSAAAHCRAELARLAHGVISLPILRKWVRTPIWAGGLEAQWVYGAEAIDPGPGRESGISITVPRPDVALRLGAYPGIQHMVDAAVAKGLHGLPRLVDEYIADVAQPFGSKKQYFLPGPGPVIEVVTDVHLHPPLGWCPPGAPPVRAEWLSEYDEPHWLRHAKIQSAVRDKRIDIIDDMLTPTSRLFSQQIRKKHPRSVWIAWLQGALSLAVRRWPGWDTGFLGAAVRRDAIASIRAALASSARWTRGRRLGMNRWFHMQQRDPQQVYPYKVGM